MERPEPPTPTPTPKAGRASDHLANERTFLAWVRTALGLIGMGFVLARMGVFLRQIAGIGHPGPHRAPRGSHEFLVTGVVFLLLGAATTVGSCWLYNRGRKAIDDGHFEPPWRAVAALTVVVVSGALVVTALVLRQLVESAD